MSLLAKAARVYRKRGVTTLGREGATYAVNETRRRARDVALRARGEFELTVDGVTTTFRVGNMTEATGLRYLADNERLVLEDIMGSLRADDVFYDVGANVGFYTCPAAAVAGEVVAFEPFPPNVGRLHENLARNRRSADIRELALSDEAGEAEFARGNMQPGFPMASLSPGDDDRITVRTARGDELIAAGEVPAPTVVKVDVEGAEGLVVDGLREALAGETRLVYCEVHRPTDHRGSVEAFDTTEDEIRGTLDRLGFEVEELLADEEEVYLRAASA